MDILAFNRCVNRAGACAGSAVDALVSVDYILTVTLGDSLYRTFSSTCATANAGISNFVSHWYFLL